MIGDPTRAAMLGALLGGEALPAGELARRAGIAPATATSHLAGGAGAAIASVMLERSWITRVDGSRAVRLTLRGREGLFRTLGLECGK